MSVVVVMPAFQESEGIASFITELSDNLKDLGAHFIVVDDFSSDKTSEAALALKDTGISISVIRNNQNLGHGPSTVLALRLGSQMNLDYVIAIDGDGQFVGRDVRTLVDTLQSVNCDVVEGVRTNRNDPVYRQTVSFLTRCLVWSRTRDWPMDANTPLRAYRQDALKIILDEISSDSMTPNLLISTFSRKTNMSISEVPVQSIPRRGTSSIGTTWGRTPRQIPSRRFIRFCLSAFRQWFKL